MKHIAYSALCNLGSALLLFIASLDISADDSRATSYTYPQLVEGVTDLSLLAKLPQPGETTSLVSSYDRSVQYDATQDKYLNWGKRKTPTGVVRMEGDESVLADIKGPGCIWRISVTSIDHNQGHLKIYLDDSAAPVVDLPTGDYFSGKVEPFNRQNLVYTLPDERNPAHGIGFANYTPISFQKSCRIVGDKDWGKGYQFNYTQFPAGTMVPTFQMKLSSEDAAALDKADKILGQCGQAPSPQANEQTQTATIDAVAGQDTSVATLSGTGAITALKVKLNLPTDPEAQRVLLSQLTVSITWDDDRSPAVWSPLGDFFGYVGGAIPFNSLPVGLSNDGTFYSYWYMPYGTKASLVVGNNSAEAVSMNWQITHAPLTEPVADLARFHAKWHRDAFPPDRPDRQPDWTLLTTQGRGRFVGTHLHGWNPLAALWGEGVDKFFVDGEKFPSTFGIGSEPYFGYFGRSATIFSKPFSNQILNESNENHFDDNRWHISDSVPFQTAFDAYLEKTVPNNRRLLYAAEAYWYLSAGGTDPYVPVPSKDCVGWWNNMFPVFHEPGAIDGSALFAMNSPANGLMLVNTLGGGNDYSGGHVLQWWPGKDENSFSLKFPAATSGKYHFCVRYTIRQDHGQGIVQFSVDGKPLGQQQLLYGPKDTLGPEVDLGLVDLTAGQHAFGIEYVQKAPSDKIGKAPYVGLDYLKLVPGA